VHKQVFASAAHTGDRF